VPVTPDNMCYVLRCPFFIESVGSTGCELDHIPPHEEEEISCPYVLERALLLEKYPPEPTHVRLQKMEEAWKNATSDPHPMSDEEYDAMYHEEQKHWSAKVARERAEYDRERKAKEESC